MMLIIIILIIIIIIIVIKELTVQHHCHHQLHQPSCETSEGKSPQLIQVQGVRWIGTGIQVADGFHLKPAMEKYGNEQIGFGPHIRLLMVPMARYRIILGQTII